MGGWLGESFGTVVHLGRSTMPGWYKVCQIGRSEQQVHFQQFVAFGVQGTGLAPAFLCLVNRWFNLGHFVAMGPLTFPNLNIATIWVRDPWVSIQINFFGSLLPTKEVPQMCKIVNYFNSWFTLGHFVALGPLTFPNLNISTIWVTDPWVPIQINCWGSLLPTKEVSHTCKIVNYF